MVKIQLPNRQRCFLIAFTWVAYGVGFLTGNVAQAADKPNVLLICIDDLKPTLGCYGDPTAKTPNIDRLAKRSVLFEAAYCNQAVCSPSRNSLMTGLRPQTLGIYDLATHFRKGAPDSVTMAQHFLQHGYHTQGLGKILHVGHGNYDDEASWSVPSWRPKVPQYRLPASTQVTRQSKSGDKGAATEAAEVADEDYADGQLALEASARIRQAAAGKSPFLIAVGFVKPHLPFVAPKRYWDLYNPAELPMPEVTRPPLDAPAYAPTAGGELRSYSDIPQKDPLPDALTRHLIHGYYAATSYTDAQIGKLLDALEETSSSKNTVIVLWGDHGWHLGDHGMWCKHTNYEQAARIPVMVSAPGCAAGVKTNALIETVDIYPTLCELAGVPLRKELDGTSFVRVLKDPTEKTREHVIHVYPRNQLLGRAIRTERYRLVEWKIPGQAADKAEFELYDYQDDPLETRNLVKEQPEIVARLKAVLATHPEARKAVAAEAKPTTEKASEGKSPGKTGGNQATEPAKEKKNDRVSMFRKRDLNQDGYLSKEEFLLKQPDPDEAVGRFPKFDKDGDGKLSESEFVRSGK